MSRTLERLVVCVAFIALLVLVLSTNGRLARVTKAETSRFTHLDHRITTLRNRMDTTDAASPKADTKAESKEGQTQPSAFDQSAELQGFEMPMAT